MSLTTSRLILRPWRETDLSSFARLNADPDVMEFLPKRLTRDESDAMAGRIRSDMEKRGWGLWAIEVKVSEANPAGNPGVPFIGYVGLSIPSFETHFSPLSEVACGAFDPARERRDFHEPPPCVEIGWRLAKEHWGFGYASEAASASLRFAFESLTLQQIVAFTVPLNKRSIRVMERIGMTRELAGDFEHPKLSPGHPLRSHILYRANRTAWLNRDAQLT